MIELKNRLGQYRSSYTTHKFLNTIRYLIVVPATVISLSFIGKIHWLLAVAAALPVYILLLNLVGILIVPFYCLMYCLIAYVSSSLNSDGKVGSEISKTIEKQKEKTMWPFTNPKIESDERKKCLAYYEAESRVTAFQTREADLFNNALVKYLNSMEENPVAASKMCKAANRLVQAIHEAKRRHEEIKSIPDVASATRLAWHLVYQSVTAWAEGTLSAIETLANGMKPDSAYLQHLVEEYQAALHRAQEEDKKFLRRLKVAASEIETIFNTTNKATAADSWQPESSDYDFSETSEVVQEP
jgi:hypothetical protein